MIYVNQLTGANMLAKKPAAPFLRTAYNYDTNEAGNEDAIHCKDKTLTQQQFAAETDINNIMQRFIKTGELPRGGQAPTYQDYEGVFDFHTAMNAIAQANQTFNAMPAQIRARFHNDPGEFVDFCSNDNNRPEAEKMGLLIPKIAQEPLAEQTPPTPPAPGADAPPGLTAPASKGKK